jgi:hypothetical protein
MVQEESRPSYLVMGDRQGSVPEGRGQGVALDALCLADRPAFAGRRSVSRSGLPDDFRHLRSLALATMPRAEAPGGITRGDRDVGRRAKAGGFGAVPLGFAAETPHGSAESFILGILGTWMRRRRGGSEHEKGLSATCLRAVGQVLCSVNCAR